MDFLFLIIFLATFFGGVHFVTSLMFSIPISRLLHPAASEASYNPQNSKTPLRWSIWIAIWTIVAIGCFVTGYWLSAGIRYYQKPLSTGYRIAHGLTVITYFFAPMPYQFCVALLTRHRFQTVFRYGVAVHLLGLSLFAVSAVTWAILLSTILSSWDFIIPNGYNPGFPEVEAVTTYSFLFGLFLLSAVLIIGGTRRRCSNRNRTTSK